LRTPLPAETGVSQYQLRVRNSLDYWRIKAHGFTELTLSEGVPAFAPT
jgi:hypothetical protein